MTGTARLDIEGPGAPPRSNGELVFAEPWESRAFGLAMALHDSGAFEWQEFRSRLIATIASWETDHPPGDSFSYYRCWLRALESVMADHGVLSSTEVAARERALAARPNGHDHRHDPGPS